MIDAYKSWYTHYVCDVWRGECRELPGQPAEQIELPMPAAVRAPDYYTARLVEGRAWIHLNAVLEYALLDRCIDISVHGSWLREIKDDLSGEFTYWQLIEKANWLARLLDEHHLYSGEAADCIAVRDALRARAKALRILHHTEGRRYHSLLLSHENPHQ